MKPDNSWHYDCGCDDCFLFSPKPIIRTAVADEMLKKTDTHTHSPPKKTCLFAAGKGSLQGNNAKRSLGESASVVTTAVEAAAVSLG